MATEELHGRLLFHSETGTEGGYWAFQVDSYTHGAEFDCGLKYCPVKMGWSPQHSSYYGMVIVKTGDYLHVRDPDTNEIVFDGEVALGARQDPYDFSSYAAGGAYATHFPPPANVNHREWDKWFLKQWPAILTTDTPPDRKENIW